MIVEGIVTSVDTAGLLNVAPMGPIVVGDFASLLLRPFQPSTTFNNLAATGCGVFHVIDRVDVISCRRACKDGEWFCAEGLLPLV